jgi:hypothetical protein
MMRKTGIAIIFVILLIIAIGLVAYFVVMDREITINIPQSQIQKAVNKKMPYKKQFALIFTLIAQDTQVILKDGSDRIGAITNVKLDINLGGNTVDLGGSIHASTGIRYDNSKFCFFLKTPAIEEVKIRGIPEQYTSMASATCKTIMLELINEVPVYTIKDKDLKTKLAKAVLKRVEIADGALAVTLGY